MGLARIVIIGAGQSGQEAATGLRRHGYAGALTLVGEEPHLPYQRPPLSKAYIQSEMLASELHLDTDASLANQSIDFLRSDAAVQIDRAARIVHLASGAALPYDHLILATGSRPRRIAGAGETVLGLRGLDDANALRARLAGAENAIVIGAGFIGLEFATVARAMGVEVTLVEREAQVMARVSSPLVALSCQRHHEAKGTRVLLSRSVTGIERHNDGANTVNLDTGETVTADFVLAAVGVVPNSELAESCGLECRNGIVVDSHLHTADAAISAIGDCAAFALPGMDRHIRLESVQNAVDQANHIALELVEGDRPYDQVPMFWTDQGGLRLQIAGIASADDELVLRGDHQDAFSVFHLNGGRLTCVESVNKPGDHMAAKLLLKAGIHPSAAQLADPAVNLRALAASVVAA